MNKDELVLTAALTQVNDAIGRYILRVLNEATGQGTTEYTVPIREVEYTLGRQLVELGHGLQARAEARGLVVVDHDAHQEAGHDRDAPRDLGRADGGHADRDGDDVGDDAAGHPPRRKPDIPEF